MKNYSIGADIGGTTVKIGLFETAGTLVKDWEIPTRHENNGRCILNDVAKSVTKELENEGISKKDVEGLGLAVPGPVLDDGTVIKCVNLGWGVFNVARKMFEISGIPVKAGNDANIAALGEMWRGGGRGFRSIVMVTLGTGIGGGIIVDGKMLTGANGDAGEIGHIPINPNEPLICSCGKRGCLEQYASATGIARLAVEYLEKNDTPSILRKLTLKKAQTNPIVVSDNVLQESTAGRALKITAKNVFDAAKAGDEVALAQVENFGDVLGRGLASISCVVNPEAFVIGGGVAAAGQILLDAVQKYYRKYAFHAARGTEFRLASLGNNAGIYGCVKMLRRP